MISYTSAVLLTRQYDRMVDFYRNVLEQQIRYDFDGCIQFESGLPSGGCGRIIPSL
jgi:hypothetical protein